MPRRARVSVSGSLLWAAILAGIALLGVLGARERNDPATCPPGLVRGGARCCGGDQWLSAAGCAGPPSSCAETMRVAYDGSGCAVEPGKIVVVGGRPPAGSGDWQAPRAGAGRGEVGDFEIDRTEVTIERWRECVRGGACQPPGALEPGLPVTDVSVEEAERFCSFAGGRLPTGAEWMLAAAGDEARRFPWGATGLVCRRAVFGLDTGPCGRGARGPDLAGARPDGSTPAGLLDLAGNVAEWTREPDGGAVARGGSYRSRMAGELLSWAFERVSGPAHYVGFRCVYARPAAHPTAIDEADSADAGDASTPDASASEGE